MEGIKMGFAMKGYEMIAIAFDSMSAIVYGQVIGRVLREHTSHAMLYIFRYFHSRITSFSSPLASPPASVALAPLRPPLQPAHPLYSSSCRQNTPQTPR